MVPKPAVDIRYDGLRHWPKFGDKCNIGRVCSMLSCSTLFTKVEQLTLFTKGKKLFQAIS